MQKALFLSALRYIYSERRMWGFCETFEDFCALQKSDVLRSGDPRLATVLLISAESIAEFTDAIAFLQQIPRCEIVREVYFVSFVRLKSADHTSSRDLAVRWGEKLRRPKDVVIYRSHRFFFCFCIFKDGRFIG